MNPQGCRSRGFWGVTSTPAFLPSPGIFEVHNGTHNVLIFPEILLPAVVHLHYLDQFGALVNPSGNQLVGMSKICGIDTFHMTLLLSMYPYI